MLAQLSAAGLSVARMVVIMPSLCSPPWRAPAKAIMRRVSCGERLSRSLAAEVQGLSSHLVAIIAAGEEQATLPDALDRAARQAEEAEQRQREIRKALTYPTVLVVGGIASVALIATVVLPRFEAVLRSLGSDLPASAHIVLSIARVAPSLLLALLLGIAGVWALILGGGDPIGMRTHFDQALLALPLIGRMVRLQFTMRLCATMASLIGGGIAIPRAVALAAMATTNRTLLSAMARARNAIVQGERVSLALEHTGVLGTEFALLVRVGEETNDLPQAFGQIARLARFQHDLMVQRVQALIEPAVLLGVALFVAGVAVALMQTIYSVRPSP
jgi:general secretion pathway protein F